MPQIFHRATNSISKVSIFGAVFFVAALLWVLGMMNRSPYVTQVRVIREQPVPFSHEHHVRGLGIDCRYCHTSVENSSFAGIPPTRTCMTCHSQIWSDSPTLLPVRESFKTDRPIEWTRVHDLPDFVYFNHSIHVAKGVACVTCHGPVETMPLTWREKSLNMEWCIGCHRHPEDAIGPKEAEFVSKADGDRAIEKISSPGASASEILETRKRLAAENHVRVMTDCSTCHR